MKANNNKITVSFVSLGCPKNLVDSEVMIGFLSRDHFTILPPDKKARVIVINTCSFIGDAKEESIDAIMEAAQKKKNKHCDLIVVTGCLPQRYKNDLTKLLPEVDLFLGTGEFDQLPRLIRNKLAGTKRRTYISHEPFLPQENTPRIQTTPFYSKYVKISEGCSHQCSFCIIPRIRGPLASRMPDDIVREIKNGMAQGVKEFNLIAQDLNEYGRDLQRRSSLTKLLQATEALDGDFWIRLMYMYPLQFPDKLVELIARHPHIVKYVDIPLQHISNRMLKIMKRGSSSRYIYRLIDQLKTKIPDIVLRTTFIVGHPGETKQDQAELKNFLTTMQFDRVGIFKYSHEEDTASYLRTDLINEQLVEERHNDLMSLQKKISLKKNKKLVGKTLKVLFEGTSRESELLYQGRFAGQAPDIDGVVLINEGAAKIGNFCKVKITQAFAYDVLGKIV